jgi:sugar lactone lactonase YvrE
MVRSVHVRSIALLVVFALFATLIAPPYRLYAVALDAATDTDADVVTGQVDFVTRLNEDPTQQFNAPTGIAVGDYNNGAPGVFSAVADRDNNRVLLYDLTGMGPALVDNDGGAQNDNLPTTPVAVFGQTSLAVITPGTTQTTLRSPAGVAIAPLTTATGTPSVYVADTGNNRVVRFDLTTGFPAIGDSVNAQLVLGQTAFSNGTPGSGLGQMSAPQGVAVDTTNRVFVADTGNNRVLIFNNPTTNGQAAIAFLGGTVGTALNQLNTPTGVAVDAAGNLYVADTGNHRVLRFSPPFITGMAATKIFGSAAGVAGTSATALRGPTGVAVDSLNNVYIADKGNNRVLLFRQTATDSDLTADKVFGQANFTTSTANRGLAAPDFNTLNEPSAVATNPNRPASPLTDYRDLFVADTINHRALQYWTPEPNPTPTLISPTFVPASGIATIGPSGTPTTLFINGRDFASGATVTWQFGAVAPVVPVTLLAPDVTYIDSQRLSVTLPDTFFDALNVAAGVPSAGVPIVVSNPAALRFPALDPLTTAPANFPVCFPKPTITAAVDAATGNPATEAGSGGFILQITGTNFISDPAFPMTVSFNGAPLSGATIIDNVDPTPDEITVFVPFDRIAITEGTALPQAISIFVANAVPNPAGSCANVSTSAVSTFTLFSPAPTIISLDPPAVPQNNPEPIDLVITGTGFIPTGAGQTVVEFDGEVYASAVISNSGQILLPGIPASTFATEREIPIKVINPAVDEIGGGEASTTLPVIGDDRPLIISLIPNNKLVGSDAFLLTVNGRNFTLGTKVFWDGSERTVISISPDRTQLIVAISPEDLAVARTVQVTVDDPTDDLPASFPVTFTVNNPRPVIESLEPATIDPGASEFTLTIRGRDFVDGATATWNGAEIATVFISATELQAAVPANFISTEGSFPIVVTNPAPTVAPSEPRLFEVTSRANPNLQLGPLANRALGTPAFAVNATSLSDAPITYSTLTPDVCEVTDNLVTLLAIGTCTITANQEGNAEYAPANVSASFEVGEDSAFTVFLPLLR